MSLGASSHPKHSTQMWKHTKRSAEWSSSQKESETDGNTSKNPEKSMELSEAQILESSWKLQPALSSMVLFGFRKPPLPEGSNRGINWGTSWRKSGNLPLPTLLHATSMAPRWICRRSNWRMNTHLNACKIMEWYGMRRRKTSKMKSMPDPTQGYYCGVPMVLWFYDSSVHISSRRKTPISESSFSASTRQQHLRASPTNKSSSFSDHSKASLGKFNRPKLNRFCGKAGHRWKGALWKVRIKKGGYPLAIKHGWQMAMGNRQSEWNYWMFYIYWVSMWSFHCHVSSNSINLFFWEQRLYALLNGGPSYTVYSGSNLFMNKAPLPSPSPSSPGAEVLASTSGYLSKARWIKGFSRSTSPIAREVDEKCARQKGCALKELAAK